MQMNLSLYEISFFFISHRETKSEQNVIEYSYYFLNHIVSPYHMVHGKAIKKLCSEKQTFQDAKKE